MTIYQTDFSTGNVSVVRFQAFVALEHFGLLETVEAKMADPATPKVVKIAWDTASNFYRQSPLIEWAKIELPLTDQQLDELFAYAQTINYDS